MFLDVIRHFVIHKPWLANISGLRKPRVKRNLNLDMKA